jgi:hypothetical protein
MSAPHVQRTAQIFRAAQLHTCTLRSITVVNPLVRLINLSLPYAVPFLPGQWVDLHIPDLAQVGGFTVTSPPEEARTEDSTDAVKPSNGDPSREGELVPGGAEELPAQAVAGGGSLGKTNTQAFAVHGQAAKGPYIELAIRKSPDPPAKWMWRDEKEILGTKLRVRFGGGFVWPPPVQGLTARDVDRVLFVAGGVGVKYASHFTGP